ncbi:hypothetical protein B0H11DRAFT_1901541 [Mycena galericulata]|nr:hypothetical protein B0H11DRAFT_1901541 [Mycena galericulata]
MWIRATATDQDRLNGNQGSDAQPMFSQSKSLNGKAASAPTPMNYVNSVNSAPLRVRRLCPAVKELGQVQRTLTPGIRRVIPPNWLGLGIRPVKAALRNEMSLLVTCTAASVINLLTAGERAENGQVSVTLCHTRPQMYIFAFINLKEVIKSGDFACGRLCGHVNIEGSPYIVKDTEKYGCHWQNQKSSIAERKPSLGWYIKDLPRRSFEELHWMWGNAPIKFTDTATRGGPATRPTIGVQNLTRTFGPDGKSNTK